MMHLAGRVALVTGGGRGIGRTVALALAEAGADLAVVARSASELAETAAQVRAQGRQALALPLDVADSSAVAAGVEEVRRALGAVTILVNNAGVAPSLKLPETSDDLWHRTVAVNMTGAFYTCRAVLPAMQEAGWGRIINVASTAGKIGYMYNAAYVASKHGLMGLTRALATEFAKTGITINAVCPGFTDTSIVAAAVDHLVAHSGRTALESRQRFERMSPQNRLMTPEEVAATVLFLTTEGARGINGQGIVIDGGGVQS